jgi:hypothetical protein
VTTRVLAQLHIQQAFEIEVDAFGHAMGTILMQHRIINMHHFEKLLGIVLN